MSEADREEMRQRVAEMEARGLGVTQGSTMAANFPKNLPPTGMAYSVNFARFHKDGVFAAQNK